VKKQGRLASNLHVGNRGLQRRGRTLQVDTRIVTSFQLPYPTKLILAALAAYPWRVSGVQPHCGTAAVIVTGTGVNTAMFSAVLTPRPTLHSVNGQLLLWTYVGRRCVFNRTAQKVNRRAFQTNTRLLLNHR